MNENDSEYFAFLKNSAFYFFCLNIDRKTDDVFEGFLRTAVEHH